MAAVDRIFWCRVEWCKVGTWERKWVSPLPLPSLIFSSDITLSPVQWLLIVQILPFKLVVLRTVLVQLIKCHKHESIASARQAISSSSGSGTTHNSASSISHLATSKALNNSKRFIVVKIKGGVTLPVDYCPCRFILYVSISSMNEHTVFHFP